MYLSEFGQHKNVCKYVENTIIIKILADFGLQPLIIALKLLKLASQKSNYKAVAIAKYSIRYLTVCQLKDKG